ncbi:S8/S53 family peptidase [uncultured Dokdonia sp.]|uniref:S8/S53 family peptidase n=1 Tax=uncultured Dokdonia sp. TaxID=575653 RepID=UPI0026394F42|nr:S8/S53 family peptidase [uncultured Dokdonia sp.]
MRKILLTISFITSIIVCQGQDHTAIYIKFDAALELQELENLSTLPQFNTLKAQYDFTIKKALALSDKKIESLSKNGHSIKNIFKIEPSTSGHNIDALISDLNELPSVVYCYKKTITPAVLPGDIPPVTPLFEALQGYIEHNPGVSMRYAWELGFSGEGISIRDIEEGINLNHEELNDQSTSIQPNVTLPDTGIDQDHGTEVAGVIYSDNGSYGTTGLAFGADQYIVYPRVTLENGFDEPLAISSAIQDSNMGDVIIYEIQGLVIEDGDIYRFTPSEFDQVIWDLTKVATEAGIIIVAAAGNGAQDLDSDFYQEYIDRGDSGAIIVSAGTPDINHDPLTLDQDIISAGNYGSRVNVHGWGLDVFTTSGSGVIQIGNDFNQGYTDNFNGTSSATAIVSGCVAVLQGYYYDLTEEYLTSIQLRDLLIETGTPQGESEAHIGPLPNMENAINEIQAILGLQNPETLLSFVSPNPASDYINIQLQNTHNAPSIISLYSTLGEKIASKNIQGNTTTIDVKNYATGIYFLEISSENDRHIKKVIIN